MAAAGHLGGGRGDFWGLKRNSYLLGLGVFAHYPSPPPPWQIFQILLIFWPKITKKGEEEEEEEEDDIVTGG